MEEEEPSLESLLGSLPPAALQLLMDVEQRASRAEALALQALQEKQVQFAEKRAAALQPDPLSERKAGAWRRGRWRKK